MPMAPWGTMVSCPGWGRPGQNGWVDEEVLAGGVANAGRVTRFFGHVLRPSNLHSASIHRFLSSLAAAGFNGASVPVSIDADGRERLVFIEGDVPVPPYPGWAQLDGALTSIAALMRRFHDTSRSFDPTGLTWSSEMADPEGGSIVCHNDVCLENVVFRDGVAVGLLDFDFAAPGRPAHDLAQFARMCVPIDDDINAARLGWEPVDGPARLRLVAECYGLVERERYELLESLARSIAHGGEFVRRRVQAGDQNFIKMWNEMGGMECFDRRRRWWAEHQKQFIGALR
jgi:Phosphotransferase enzyme family